MLHTICSFSQAFYHSGRELAGVNNGGRRDAYNQLLQITRQLNDSLVTLCEGIIPVLPELPEPQRAKVADALTAFAVDMRDQLQIGGEFKRLAETVELQTNELAKAKTRLDKVRHDLKAAYSSVSESSGLRTRLVVLDEHLAEIEQQLKLFGPPSQAVDPAEPSE